MPEVWLIILIHQIIFQGMFIIKNILLSKKIKKQIRGNNIEATISIIYFSSIIIIAFMFSFFKLTFGEIQLINELFSLIIGLIFLIVSLIISGASLFYLGDSWRVGVIEDQKTELITSGIYQYTRNPYFVSYLVMFFAYIILLQNILFPGLLIVAIFFVHRMILREEKYLKSQHLDAFSQYKKKVPRYIIL